MELTDRNVVVIGAGRSGVAAAALLAWLGARPVVTDRREEAELPHLRPLDERVRLALGGHPTSLWEEAGLVVVSPGIPDGAPPVAAARERGLPVVSEIELAGAHASAPCVAVTGSNGKSTVVSMIAAALAEAGLDAPACGNIGRPFSTAVLEELRDGRPVDLYVLELSSFQTETIVDLHPRVAAVLNVTADHLDRHPDLNAYGAAKLRIAHNQGGDDWLVYGADDPWLARHVAPGPRRAPFSAAEPEGAPAALVRDGAVIWRDETGREQEVLAAGRLPVPGGHNLLNAAAATAVACLAGATADAVGAGLAAFRGLEHRMEPCGQVAGVHCINDSKATNVGATAASLAGLDRPTWLVLGGRDKDGDFNALRPLMRGRVRRALLIGEAAGRIAASLDGSVAVEQCGDLARAVDRALAEAAPGDTLLLAPACASFDQYADFAERGRHFRDLVAARTAGNGTEGDR